MTKFSAIFVRFFKGFLAGGIAAVAAALVAGVTIHTVDDLKKLALSLLVAFLTGGLLAIEKLIAWQDPQQPVPLPNEPQPITQSKKTRTTKSTR